MNQLEIMVKKALADIHELATISSLHTASSETLRLDNINNLSSKQKLSQPLSQGSISDASSPVDESELVMCRLGSA